MILSLRRAKASGNRRRYERLDAGQHLILISVVDRIDGILEDISQMGARVSLRGTPPREGSDVLLRWGPHELFGQVVWSRGNEVGVELHKPIEMAELADALGGALPVWLEAKARAI